MRSMEQFIISSVLILALTAAGIITSSYPAAVMSAAGILLVLMAVRDVSDGRERRIYPGGLLIMFLFMYFGGTPYTALVFYEFRINRKIQMFFPAAACVINELLKGTRGIPQIIYTAASVMFVSVVLSGAEYLITKYHYALDNTSENAQRSAVRELYEKKLNQELIIKNYLSDRNARLEERENISRNIHNSVGHSITAAIMTLDAADMLFDADPDKAREKMRAANERMRSGLASVRHAVRVLDNESGFILVSDLRDDLNEAADRFVMDTSVKAAADYQFEEDMQIMHEHAEFLTGALCEILSNGVRHGGADRFYISLRCDSTHIRLQVTDNGQSDFNEENSDIKIRNGFGIKKLISYAEKCGGYAHFENNAGFSSEITLPVRMEENDGQTKNNAC